MPTEILLGAQIGADTGSGSTYGSNLNPTITAVVDDGRIDVGDEVTISGVFTDIDTFVGIGDGSLLYYHGQGTFNGKTGFVFGDAPTKADSIGMIVLFENNVSLPADQFPVGDYVGGRESPEQTLVNAPVNCFGEGTMIATAEGETAVETLKIGDLILTGEGREVPVKWVGKQTIVKVFAPERAQLVCIKAGALGNHSDLYVTADHGMLVDSYLVNASALVNGHSVVWVPLSDTPDRVTVYHIETHAHDLILANGAAAETYLDAQGRAVFDNYQEYLDLYDEEDTQPEQKLLRIPSARLLPTGVQQRLAA